MAMFSVLASTKPTAPTAESSCFAGGGNGGGSLCWTGLMAITAVTAKSNAMAPIIGTVFFMALDSYYSERTGARLCQGQSSGRWDKAVRRNSVLSVLFHIHDPSVFHMRNTVGEIENAGVMGDDD